MECAGVDCGLKMLGLCEGSVGAPKHKDAASKPPASNTAIPAIFRPRLRVCPLHFICFEPMSFRSPRPARVSDACGAVLLACSPTPVQVLLLSDSSLDRCGC